MQNKLFKAFIGALIIINLLPILAPIFAAAGPNSMFYELGKVIYFVYSFTCHQFNWRSFYLLDFQLAWCARDVGIWLGILLAAIYAYKTPNLKFSWYWVIPFLIPIAVDGLTQTVATVLQVNPFGDTNMPQYISVNPIRFITGFLFGFAVSAWLTSSFFYPSSKLSNLNLQRLSIKIIATSVFMLLIFTTSWQITSPQNPPANLLDFAVKTPSQGFFIRRAAGLCSGTIQKPLDWSC